MINLDYFKDYYQGLIRNKNASICHNLDISLNSNIDLNVTGADRLTQGVAADTSA